jgi:hypothetical protein
MLKVFFIEDVNKLNTCILLYTAKYAYKSKQAIKKKYRYMLREQSRGNNFEQATVYFTVEINKLIKLIKEM